MTSVWDYWFGVPKNNYEVLYYNNSVRVIKCKVTVTGLIKLVESFLIDYTSECKYSALLSKEYLTSR